MKKLKSLLIIIYLVFAFGLPMEVEATELDCLDVDGMSLFGYNEGQYIFIGSISNEFSSNSIANEFGDYGSEYSSDSIFNKYGDYGSEYSSESAFNEYASYPPILINDNDEFLGYITVNSNKSPNISPYEAFVCADKSLSSSISKHEEMIFEDIPDSYNSLDSNYYYKNVEFLLDTYVAINSYISNWNSRYWDAETTNNLILQHRNSFSETTGSSLGVRNYFENLYFQSNATYAEVAQAYNESIEAIANMDFLMGRISLGEEIFPEMLRYNSNYSNIYEAYETEKLPIYNYIPNNTIEIFDILDH